MRKVPICCAKAPREPVSSQSFYDLTLSNFIKSVFCFEGMILAPRAGVNQLLLQPEITEAVFIARELSRAIHLGG